MTFGADGLSPVSGQHDPILNLVLSLTQHFEECVYAEQAPLLGEEFLFLFGDIVWEGAMPEPVLLLLGEFVIRLEDGESPFGIESDKPVLPFAHLFSSPAHHGTLIHTQGGVGYDQMFVYAYDFAKSFAIGAGTCGRVEGEHIVTGLLKGDTVGLKPGAECMCLVLWHKAQHHLSSSFVEGCLHRICQS